MSTGFETALGEITLVLFTTLAPSGAVAYVVMALAALRSSGEVRSRVGRALLVPFLVTLVGLVASATHLGNPDNALYVFARVGASPLSTEVGAAVAFLGLSGAHWLYQYAEHARKAVLDVLLGLASVAALAFLASIAFAYASRTVITWDMPLVPVALCLNAFVGGPVLAVAALGLARWEPAAGRAGRALLIAAGLSLVANICVYAAQAAGLGAARNYVATAVQLVPGYELFIAVFAVLAALGIAVDGLALFCRRPLPTPRACVACALVLAGIFAMRFAFYMMHLTMGVSL